MESPNARLKVLLPKPRTHWNRISFLIRPLGPFYAIQNNATNKIRNTFILRRRNLRLRVRLFGPSLDERGSGKKATNEVAALCANILRVSTRSSMPLVVFLFLLRRGGFRIGASVDTHALINRLLDTTADIQAG
jgi:hypothetical protein